MKKDEQYQREYYLEYTVIPRDIKSLNRLIFDLGGWKKLFGGKKKIRYAMDGESVSYYLRQNLIIKTPEFAAARNRGTLEAVVKGERYVLKRKNAYVWKRVSHA